MTASAKALGRVRSDVDVLSRAGLPLEAFLRETADTLRPVVPYVAGCFSTLDSATQMVSSTLKFDALAGRNDGDVAWARLEYGRDEPTTLRRMIAAGQVSVGMQLHTNGELERSPRMAELLTPHFDFHDEVRVVCTDRFGAWGALSLFRGREDSPFRIDDIVLLGSLSAAFTRGIRAGLLARTAVIDDAETSGPAVIIVDAQDRIVQATPACDRHLRRLAELPGSADAMTPVQMLVSAARRFASGDHAAVPRVRVRTADGAWLLMHASPLSGQSSRSGEIVVTIEGAHPQEVSDIISAILGLTCREREVMGAVLRGLSTREIAEELCLSTYTVQDHLKSVFDKAGVASRGELVASVCLDRYLPA